MDGVNTVAFAEKAANARRLTVIILTYNEALHIERCIRSALRVGSEVLVVDSFSTDDTASKARALGARVLQNVWINHATQMNWALEKADIRTDWVMRLDADEFLDEILIASLATAMSDMPADVGGLEINRRIRFMGREIRHGGMAPLWVTRLWRKGWARCEARWMDEHMVLGRGNLARLPGAIIDENLNSLTWWTQKHNAYASREAVDLLDRKYSLGLAEEVADGLNRQACVKRWIKNRLYSRLPLGIRPWLYFFYRVFVRFGFLDGSRGMLFHMLQGLWYRQLVDAKVAEVEDAVLQRSCDIREAIRDVLGIDLAAATGPNGEGAA
ncbi:glycosyltransferase family 2 protein [Thioalkalivibrio sulfidiphilus]|uniref:glycosyltransferase family 2 protein n=1 Tax=Thioalkalivibrio sulfidiphilus TaxID=1033854 RepID=UPI003BB0E778